MQTGVYEYYSVGAWLQSWLDNALQLQLFPEVRDASQEKNFSQWWRAKIIVV